MVEYPDGHPLARLAQSRHLLLSAEVAAACLLLGRAPEDVLGSDDEVPAAVAAMVSLLAEVSTGIDLTDPDGGEAYLRAWSTPACLEALAGCVGGGEELDLERWKRLHRRFREVVDEAVLEQEDAGVLERVHLPLLVARWKALLAQALLAGPLTQPAHRASAPQWRLLGLYSSGQAFWGQGRWLRHALSRLEVLRGAHEEVRAELEVRCPCATALGCDERTGTSIFLVPTLLEEGWLAPVLQRVADSWFAGEETFSLAFPVNPSLAGQQGRARVRMPRLEVLAPLWNEQGGLVPCPLCGVRPSPAPSPQLCLLCDRRLGLAIARAEARIPAQPIWEQALTPEASNLLAYLVVRVSQPEPEPDRQISAGAGGEALDQQEAIARSWAMWRSLHRRFAHFPVYAQNAGNQRFALIGRYRPTSRVPGAPVSLPPYRVYDLGGEARIPVVTLPDGSLALCAQPAVLERWLARLLGSDAHRAPGRGLKARLAGLARQKDALNVLDEEHMQHVGRFQVEEVQVLDEWSAVELLLATPTALLAALPPSSVFASLRILSILWADLFPGGRLSVQVALVLAPSARIAFEVILDALERLLARGQAQGGAATFDFAVLHNASDRFWLCPPAGQDEAVVRVPGVKGPSAPYQLSRVLEWARMGSELAPLLNAGWLKELVRWMDGHRASWHAAGGGDELLAQLAGGVFPRLRHVDQPLRQHLLHAAGTGELAEMIGLLRICQPERPEEEG